MPSKARRGVLNLHPAFASVLIDFDPRLRTHDDIEALVAGALGGRRRTRVRTRRDASRSRCGSAATPVRIWRTSRGTPACRRSASSRIVRGRRIRGVLRRLRRRAFRISADCRRNWRRRAFPRRASTCPAGSVAIGGAQAGVYPLASPGGWRLIGRTPLRSSIRGRAAAAAAHGRPRPVRPSGARMNRIRVLSPGMQTTVQDLGRFGWAHFGVSASGAADPLALRAAICWWAMRRTRRRSK